MAHVNADFAMDFPAYKEFIEQNGSGDNTYQRERMKKALTLAVATALTARQRQVISLYYFEGSSITEIAKELSLNRSTVFRHLKSARQRLKNVLNYSLISAFTPISQPYPPFR